MSNSMRYGIKVKLVSEPESRAVWISPKGTTRLLIHASGWDTQAEAESAALSLGKLNEHLIVTVGKLR